MDTSRRTRETTGTLLALALAIGASACASGGGMQVESGPEGEIRSEIPEGTMMKAELEDRLSVTEAEKGDQFHATVDEPVVRDGVEVVPAGALIHGEVTAVHRSTGEDDPNVLKLHFYRIDIRGESYPLEVELVDTDPANASDTETATKIGAGAAAGAILGAILGDGEGALIGGAIGAAAGTAVALGTKEDDGVLARGSELELRVTQAIDLET